MAEITTKQYTTVVLLKPHVANNTDMTLASVRSIKEANLDIQRYERLHFTPEFVALFYSDHIGKSHYERNCKYITSGDCIAMLISGEDAVKKVRALIGPTYEDDFRKSPLTLRGMFGRSTTENGFHGSDSTESAEKEWKLIEQFMKKTSLEDTFYEIELDTKQYPHSSQEFHDQATQLGLNTKDIQVYSDVPFRAEIKCSSSQFLSLKNIKGVVYSGKVAMLGPASIKSKEY
jgi:nucleoside-diphosphate kinase